MATSGISKAFTDSFLHDSERFLANWKLSEGIKLVLSLENAVPHKIKS